MKFKENNNVLILTAGTPIPGTIIRACRDTGGIPLYTVRPDDDQLGLWRAREGELAGKEQPCYGLAALDGGGPSPIQRRLLDLLRLGEAHIDALTLGEDPTEVIAALFELELAGCIRQLPGKRFTLAQQVREVP